LGDEGETGKSSEKLIPRWQTQKEELLKRTLPLQEVEEKPEVDQK
jgi:hypothetical protein